MALRHAHSSSRTFLFVLGVATLAMAASPAHKKNYPIPGHGTLELQLPAGLSDLLDQPEGGGPPAIALRPDDGGSYGVMIVVAWRDTETKDFGSAEHLRRALETERAPYLKQVQATDVPIVTLSGGPNPGVAYLLVDKSVVGKPREEGNWPYMRQGVIRAGDLLLKYMIMMYSRDPDPAPAVEAILLNAVHHPATDSK
jgi:hypothetical protein